MGGDERTRASARGGPFARSRWQDEVGDGGLGAGNQRASCSRLLRRYRKSGPGAIRHGLRGRPSNNRIDCSVRDYALAIVRETYADFGPRLAAEKLADRHGLTVSSETLRKWMIDDGLWKNRAQRRNFHPPRLRREHCGELVQIDGSDHRWFEEGRCVTRTLRILVGCETSGRVRRAFTAHSMACPRFRLLHPEYGALSGIEGGRATVVLQIALERLEVAERALRRDEAHLHQLARRIVDEDQQGAGRGAVICLYKFPQWLPPAISDAFSARLVAVAEAAIAARRPRTLDRSGNSQRFGEIGAGKPQRFGCVGNRRLGAPADETVRVSVTAIGR